LTQNQHTIMKFSSRMSRYMQQEFHLGDGPVGVQTYDWGAWPNCPPLPS